MKRQPTQLESFLRGGLDIATAGFLPKLHGALDAATKKRENKNETFAEIYQRERDIRRLRNIEAFEENPWSYGAGGIAGAIASPIKGSQAATLGQRAKRGALLGGLYGAGTSDTGEPLSVEPSNIIDTAKGAAIGTAGEVFLPFAFRKVGQGIEKFTPQAVKEGISKAGNKLSDLINAKPITQGALAPFKEASVPQEQATIQGIAKQAPYVEKGELAAPAINKIQQEKKAAHEIGKAAYDEAKSKIGSLDIKQIKQFMPKIEEALVSESIDPSSHPKTYAYMKNFNNMLNKEAPKNAIGVDFQRLEGWRKQLNKAISEEKPGSAEQSGLKLLKKSYDDLLNNNIEKAMLIGDPKILKEYEAAREGWKRYKQTYTAQHKDEYGKKFIQDIVNNDYSREPYTNAMIAEKIFGTNKIGFKPQSLNIIKELGNHLGRDSQEFHGLRMEGMKKVLSPLLENPNDKKAALEIYNKNLKEQLPILKELLPENVVNELVHIGEKGTELFRKNKLPIKETLGKLPLTGLVMKVLGGVPGIAKTPLQEIYKPRQDIRIPEIATRSISQALSHPKQESNAPGETQPIVQKQTNEDYEAKLARMTPEQKEKVNGLLKSMQPAQ